MGLTPALAAWSRLGAVDRSPLPSGRRFVVVHLDGVSRRALALALRKGFMPTLARWLEEGAFRLLPTLSGAPASTPAFQATLFYGERGDCPGYQWHDKRRNKRVRMDDALEVHRYEKSLGRRGRGILRGGSTYFSIVGGGAEEPTFALSRLAFGIPLGGIDDPDKNGWDRLASWLAHAVPLARSAARLFGSGPSEILDSLAWSLEKGTAKNEAKYLLNHFLLAELGREVTTYLTVLDVCRGVPAIYAVYAGYDEAAHRRGPFSAEALAELAKADEALAHIAEAIGARPELRYELYVLSDHGQEPTRPAEEILHGTGLADWILAGGPTDAHARGPERVGDVLALPDASHCAGGIETGGGEEGRPPLVVADAGDLAHVYFMDMPAPHDLRSLRRRWPAQLRATIDCPASGIVAVRGGLRGFAFVRGHQADLAQEGALRGLVDVDYDPEVLRRYLQEMLTTPSAGDLVVYGAGVPGGDVAYAWEFGSHGGVGSGGVETFLVHPAGVDAARLASAGPAELHAFFHERFLSPDHAEDHRRDL